MTLDAGPLPATLPATVPEAGNSLRVAVDIGGTFTDGVVTLSPDGRMWVGKTLTTPDNPGEAVSTVVLDLLRQVALVLGAAAPPLAEVVHGTTLITNTLIEREGAKTALVTTRGTRDALDIGRELRYDLYDLELALPQPLVPLEHRFELGERLSARGEVVRPLDDGELDGVMQALSAAGVEAVAVCLLHSYVNDDHEQRVAERVRQALPEVTVSISSALAREIKEFERTSTVVANAYVKPLVGAYLKELEGRLRQIGGNVRLQVMVSSGGFTAAAAAAESPIFLLESGPAAGVLSALNTASGNGVDKVLAFDMGGTTAKACVAVGGEPLIAHSFECARVHRFKRGSGLPILIPSIDLIEIGAGGGSIAHLNRMGLLNVGPQSSGSMPGPACYRQGGTEATITDADLLLGYLNPANFLGGEMPLDVELARQAMERLATRLGLEWIDVAWGIYNLVNENMASAARIHIAEKGFDPRDFTMVATGGAGPVHAVEVARKLRIPRVLASVAAGAGSCLGMLAAPARVDRAWSSPRLLTEIAWDEVARNVGKLRHEAELELQSAGASNVEWWIGAEMRYYGQGDNVTVNLPFTPIQASLEETIRAAFEERYSRLYGRLVPNARPQVITWRLTGRARTRSHRFVWGDNRVRTTAASRGKRPVYLPLRRAFEPVEVFDRYSVPAGTTLQAPLVLEERESTLVVPVKADVTILPDLTVLITLNEFE